MLSLNYYQFFYAISLIFWSFSNLSQIILNYNAKSVENFSLKYVIFNFTGAFYFSIWYSTDYFLSKNDSSFVDLIFVYHLFLISIVLIFQCTIYKKGKNQIGNTVGIINVILWIFSLLYLILDENISLINPNDSKISSLKFFRFGTICIYLVKYFPQMYLHYKREQTKGWSNLTTIFNLLGGLFFIIQLLIDSLYTQSNKFSDLNSLANLSIALIIIITNSIFLIQNYLYNEKSNNKTYFINENLCNYSHDENYAIQSFNRDNFFYNNII